MERKPYKIFFCDIDGVFNSGYSQKKYGIDPSTGYRGIDPEAVKRARSIFDDPDIYTVISSDWRYHYTIQEFQAMFPDFRVIDTTEITTKVYGFRAQEIMQYVDSHPEIDTWVAIDDIPINHPNAVHTYDSHGISPKHIRQIKAIFDKQS